MAILSRKNKKAIKQKITDFFWPTIGWKRTLYYYKKRLFRISDTPQAIAAGAATGIAISLTPFIGFHVIIILGLCFLLRANIVAGLLTSLVGNPVTFPFIWLITYLIGSVLLGNHIDLKALDGGLSMDKLQANVETIFVPMIAGGLVLGLLSWVALYFLIDKTVYKFQTARRKRLDEKRQSNKKAFNARKMLKALNPLNYKKNKNKDDITG